MAPKLATPVDHRIGARVRAARERAGLSQVELSRHLGISFQQLQKNESGKNRISVGRLQAIADRLGVLLSDLYDEQGPVSPRLLTVEQAREALCAASEAYADALRRAAMTYSEAA